MTTPTALAPFALDDETRAIAEAVRERCAEFPEDYWARCDAEHRDPIEFFRAMAEGGWLGITIDLEYGGGGQSVTQAAVMMREVAASGAGINGCVPLHVGMFATEPLARHGSPELKQQFLPKIASGERRVRRNRTDGRA